MQNLEGGRTKNQPPSVLSIIQSAPVWRLARSEWRIYGPDEICRVVIDDSRAATGRRIAITGRAGTGTSMGAALLARPHGKVRPFTAAGSSPVGLPLKQYAAEWRAAVGFTG